MASQGFESLVLHYYKPNTLENMIGINLKQEDFENRKEYLVAVAILYIRSHTGYSGVDDAVFFDEAECDGYALADDLEAEFNL